MKPLKQYAIIPVLAVIGLAAPQVAVPAHGDDAVKVCATILVNFNGVTGYINIGDPLYDRIVERMFVPTVVYEYRDYPWFMRFHERHHPVMVMRKEYRDYGHEVWGHDNRGHDNMRYHPAENGRPGYMERYNNGNDRYDKGNGPRVQYEEHQNRDNGHKDGVKVQVNRNDRNTRVIDQNMTNGDRRTPEKTRTTGIEARADRRNDRNTQVDKMTPLHGERQIKFNDRTNPTEVKVTKETGRNDRGNANRMAGRWNGTEHTTK